MAHRVCLCPEDEKVFSTIARRILKAKSPEEMRQLFSVLCGQKEIGEVEELNGLTADQSSWNLATQWVNWFLNPNILSNFH